MKRSGPVAAILLTCATAFAACGGVAMIDVHDGRVPLEARQWVGGADDAVAIARAGLDDALAAKDELGQWKRALRRTGSLPAAAKPLEVPLAALIEARTKLATASVERARADLELARAARTLVHAETAMRYDLAVYDLTVLRTERDGARRELDRRGRRVEEVTATREQATVAFWSAYRTAFGQSPAVGRVFWLATD